MKGQGDDGMNVHGNYAVIEKVISNNQVKLDIEFGDGPTVEEKVEFRNRENLQQSFVSTITSFDSRSGVAQFRDNLPSSVRKFDLIGSLSALPALLVKNCIFRSNRARGILVTTSNAIITNCTFDHTSGPGIEIMPDGWYWFQSSTVKNLTIAECRFNNVDYGAAKDQADIMLVPIVPVYVNGTPSTQGQPLTQGQVDSDIVISKNIFQQNQNEYAVQSYATSTLQIVGNVIYSNSDAPFKGNFYVSNSVGVDQTANTCYRNGIKSQNCTVA